MAGEVYLTDHIQISIWTVLLFNQFLILYKAEVSMLLHDTVMNRSFDISMRSTTTNNTPILDLVINDL